MILERSLTDGAGKEVSKDMRTYRRWGIGVLLLLISGSTALAQQVSIQERVVALKASLAASEAILKRYEWVETTVVSVKGEEKSRKQERCYYGVDGGLQKVVLYQTAPPPKKRGFLGRIAAKKQEKLAAHIKEAVALVRMYIPPDQGRIQKAKDNGKLSITPVSEQRVKLTFSDHIKSGDILALEVELAGNRPVHAKVTTYVDSQKKPVTLDVSFDQLDNGVTYASKIVLDDKSERITINVQNSGYRTVGK
jgi:hypothetical protein